MGDHIRAARTGERELLVQLWRRSVAATHGFVAPGDLDAMVPAVRGALHRKHGELWVACDAHGAAVGFMGMAGNAIESLFVDPAHFRQGVGTHLIERACAGHDELLVDVNEQNHGARAFYAACGFVVYGRSAVDGQGRPYPLLHMRLSVRDRATTSRSAAAALPRATDVAG